MKKLRLSGVCMFLSAAVFAQTAPVISAFTPTSGPVNTSVIIAGSNFNTTMANNMVYFGDTKATVTAASSTSLTVTVPAGASFLPISVLNTAIGLNGFATRPFIPTFSGNTYSFTPKSDLATGTYPYGIASGDFNNDGKTDLVVSNSGSSNISVFPNNSTIGAISFSAKQNLAAGSNPAGIAVGDLDGDGKKDIAVSNEVSNTISLFRNTSSGSTISFATAVSIATSANPRSITISDLNADGKADIIATTVGGYTLDIFKNSSTSGAFSFAAKSSISISSNPESVTTGDIDGDGKPDLVVANGTANGISVYRNTTTGTTISFAGAVAFTAVAFTQSVATGDFDGDGKIDVAAANRNTSNVSVLRNTSSVGTISFATQQSFGVGYVPYAVSVSDVNGDGKPDLTVANASSQSGSVAINRSTAGSLTFDVTADFSAGSFSCALVTTDLDGDSRPDLAIANNGASTMSTLRNIIPVTLPVEGLAFSAVKKLAVIQLDWSTATEINSRSFELEKSADGIKFTLLATLQAAGNATSKTIYRFDDKTPFAGINYYRLKQVDLDGRSRLSPVVSVNWKDVPVVTVAVTPQPVKNMMRISIEGNTGNGNLIIYDMNGRTIKKYQVLAGTSSFMADRSNMPAGLYVYKLTSDNGEILASGKIVTE